MPCECVVSGWSLWPECLLNYDSKSFEQVRTRFIINYPPPSNTHGVLCPELTETRSYSILYNLTWVTSSCGLAVPHMTRAQNVVKDTNTDMCTAKSHLETIPSM